MPVKDFMEYLKVLVKEEFEAVISVYGNVLVLKFADGTERIITVE